MENTVIKVAVVLFSLWISCVQAQNKKFPAVLAFGDSILDTGNNNLLLTVTRCNFVPYGRDFPNRIPTGRFGNGRVLSDFIAAGLGVKNLVPAFRSLFLKKSDLSTGVCFASGGSGLDKLTASLQNVIWVQDQVKDFEKYIEKLNKEVGDAAKVKAIIANALVLISTGNNDLGITYFSTPARRDKYNIQTYTEMLIGWKTTFLNSLYALGARKFAVMGTLPIGCTPGARKMNRDPVCLPHVNFAAKLYNEKVATLVNQSNQRYSDAKFVYVDLFNPLFDMVQNSTKYGFKTANPCCCAVMAPIPCLNSSNHVFWDFAHPSQRAYETLIPKVLNTITSNLA